MKTTQRDYTKMTELCEKLGMSKYTNRMGNVVDGFYTLNGMEAPVDLTACAEDETSILKTALKQLSEQCDESYHQSIEKDLAD